MRMSLTGLLVPALMAVSLVLPAASAAEPPAPFDAGPFRARLKVAGDGQGHYVAFVPFVAGVDRKDAVMFYGDGKTFHRQETNLDRLAADRYGYTFDEPRWRRTEHRPSFRVDGDAHRVLCSDRTTELRRLSDGEAAKLLEAATFTDRIQYRRAYALARDERGAYYYVDREATHPEARDFRVYVGPRGNLRRLKMKNVILDGEGALFVTSTGKLRLVLEREGDSAWIRGKARTTLKRVPIDDNRYLVYAELGVYRDVRFGTPCDDL